MNHTTLSASKNSNIPETIFMSSKNLPYSHLTQTQHNFIK